MSNLNKILTILVTMAFFLLIGKFGRDKYIHLYDHNKTDLILKAMPSFEALDVVSNKIVDRSKLLGDRPDAVIVHFWGTWCAPCEAEFPELLNFSKRLSKRNIKFVFLAVNDELKKVKKFLARFKEFPQNSYQLLDEDGDTMGKFGTVKVPETYVFRPDGSAYKKFIGPQDWEKDYYFQTIINLVENKLETFTQETH